MGVEKESSKNGGGYVGGFFQLFDWTAKSRKKLFTNKSELPENSKQGKRRDGNFPMTRLHLMDEDETMGGLSIRECSDYSCASSVTDDDGFGAKAPGVVARLMGLDSMPTSSFSEPNSTPFLDTQSLREASQRRKHFEYCNDPQIMYSGNLLNKEDCPPPPRTFMDPKPQKILSRPIEKFQTETLPPRSAKSIPITHHKLLSPIKSPGFIPSRTAAHIMEAASRIIDPSPQATARTRMCMAGSSSVPLKVRDLKEKMEGSQKMSLVGQSTIPVKARDLKENVEAPNRTPRLQKASQRPVESNAAKCLKGQPLNKSWNGSADNTTSFRTLPEREDGSSSSKNKGKSISLAIQAKVNVQRRESLNISSSGLVGHKEQNEDISSHSFRSQPNAQKSLPRKSSTHNASGVLRQNNQKQNSLMDREKSSKSAASNVHGRKALSTNSSLRHKTLGKTGGSKTGTRKLGSETTDSEKGHSRKKRTIDGNLHTEKNRVSDDMLVDNSQKESESKPAMDRHFSWTEESKKKGVDVVSFTFTAPLMRTMPGYDSSGQLVQKSSGACMDNRGKRLLLDTDSMKLSSIGYNVIGGDALSSLLDQKLRELSNSIQSSGHNSVKGLGSASFLQDLSPTVNSGGSTPIFHLKKDQNVSQVDKFSSNFNSDAFSTDSEPLRMKRFQGVGEMLECSSKSYDSEKLLDHRRPSPVSVLEPSFSTETSCSLDSTDCSSTEGTKQCSSIQAHLRFSSSKNFSYVDAEADLSDSASSTSNGTAAGKRASTLAVTYLARSSDWEITYVQKILHNLEFMFRDYALGLSSEIINPHLFNQLESRKDGFFSDDAETTLERKVIFDCVSEGVQIRCGQYVSAGYKEWSKGVLTVRRKERLAEEVLKEISAWKNMGDCMVDELVDKDMSSQHGRWLEFEDDAFSFRAEIEDQIYDMLLDEVVEDIFGCPCC